MVLEVVVRIARYVMRSRTLRRGHALALPWRGVRQSGPAALRYWLLARRRRAPTPCVSGGEEGGNFKPDFYTSVMLLDATWALCDAVFVFISSSVPTLLDSATSGHSN